MRRTGYERSITAERYSDLRSAITRAEPRAARSRWMPNDLPALLLGWIDRGEPFSLTPPQLEDL